MGEENGKRQFRFCIDRGGTFTDVYAEVPGEPNWRVVKILSVDPSNYDDAPAEGIRRILEEVTGEKIPRSAKIPTYPIEWIRMGTTVATNALLERKGERVGLCVTRGFKDLLQIGNQARPKIFDLTVSKSSQLYEEVIEADERVQLALDGIEEGAGIVRGVSGEYLEVVKPLDEKALKPLLEGLLKKGIRSLAVVFIHSYIYPAHELAVERLAKALGFKQVSLSSALIPMVRAVPRGYTATVDAYLTPVIKDYLSGFLSRFDEDLDKVNVLFMQSDGGLAPENRFSGHKAILSGPAGGVVGYARTTFLMETEKPLIGFDMGGTSTDVSRYAGSYEQVLETQTAGVTIQAPQLDINTVAAGGGSKLKFQVGVFKVGPESVGAHPGPVCYRKGGELAVTDANLVLGRVIPDYFPSIFGPKENEPLDLEATRTAFIKLAETINAYRKKQDPSSKDMTVEEIALGFINVANEAMCRPIRQLTEMKGHETKKHALACFGGAGPQHACAIARALGMREVIIHRYCGILSAYGMGLADVVEEAQEPYAAVYGTESLSEVSKRANFLTEQVKEELRLQGFKNENMNTELYLNLRYEGTDTTMMIKAPRDGSNDFAGEFVKLFRQEYGFELQKRHILISDVRVRGVGVTNILKLVEMKEAIGEPKAELFYKVYFESGWQDTPVYVLKNLGYGHTIEGPAIIMNGNSTLLIEPFCKGVVTKYGNIRFEIGSVPIHTDMTTKVADVVQLSIFNNRFMGIAEQMGRTLQRTSISTNIKERLDFSCALFSPDGGLVANAPHVPVHLGAMSSTVRWQLKYWGENLREGDVLVTNHPCAGGSHLPDITVITPVFRNGRLIFFVASRGHHAEIGGITPGSMPPFSKAIWEEGASIKAFKLVEQGIFQEEGIIKLLQGQMCDEHGQHTDGVIGVIPGTRRLDDNLSDLRAQVAANQRGIVLIGELIEQYSLGIVQAYMMHVQTNAEAAVREMLKSVAARAAKQSHLKKKGSLITLEAEDYMDDGSLLHLKLTIDENKGEAYFDFEGTSTEVYGNWNAPEAVTMAAVIYCLRCLVDVDIPLNQGCLAPVTIHIPLGSLLSPSEKAAVVGGNVLTSQRVTDVVLTAFQACACSQGCMNNLTFGDKTFGYYETIGGGCGAGPGWNGTSGVQCHMTNTRITDPEILEQRYPVLLHRFGLRKNSGGAGQFKGGDGIVREIEYRRPITVSILSERRVHAPKGLMGGKDGACGQNFLIRKDGHRVYLGGKNTVDVQPGEILQILTPGGGGWGYSS
uniref:Oxoprolinase 1 n=1 Tax=Juniperus procera TaxID=62753 RepID=A0A3Q8BTK4_9CONI|nr:oxoprolinase 1 [Juniperus procera]